MSKTDKFINLGISKEMLEQIENYQFDNRINSRSEAIRQLIKKGLEQE